MLWKFKAVFVLFCLETQHNAGGRPAGGPALFAAPSSLWAHHRGSRPWLAGGGGAPERREFLRQEGSEAGRRADGQGRGFGWDRHRWFTSNPPTTQSLPVIEGKWFHPLFLLFRCEGGADDTQPACLWGRPLRGQAASWTKGPHRSENTWLLCLSSQLSFDVLILIFSSPPFSAFLVKLRKVVR